MSSNSLVTFNSLLFEVRPFVNHSQQWKVKAVEMTREVTKFSLSRLSALQSEAEEALFALPAQSSPSEMREVVQIVSQILKRAIQLKEARVALREVESLIDQGDFKQAGQKLSQIKEPLVQKKKNELKTVIIAALRSSERVTFHSLFEEISPLLINQLALERKIVELTDVTFMKLTEIDFSRLETEVREQLTFSLDEKLVQGIVLKLMNQVSQRRKGKIEESSLWNESIESLQNRLEVAQVDLTKEKDSLQEALESEDQTAISHALAQKRAVSQEVMNLKRILQDKGATRQ